MSFIRLGLVAVFAFVALRSGVAAPPAKTPTVSATDWELYGAQLRSAHRAWQSGNVTDAWRELGACRWDLRGWEHRHLCALLMRNQAILTRDGSYAEFTPEGHLETWSPKGFRSLRDGRTFERIDDPAPTGKAEIRASCEGSTIRIHPGRLNEVRRSWVAHDKAITALAMSRDATRVASGAKDATLYVWDSTTGKKLLDLKGLRETVEGLTFSPDGSRLVSTSHRLIRVWDARTGRAVTTREGSNGSKPGIVFSSDMRRILSAGDEYDTASVWDATTGRDSMRFRVKGVGLTRVAFCPDGLAVATGHADGTVRLWETRTGRLLETFRGHEGEVYTLSFSPEGARLVSSAGDRTVRMWDVRMNPPPVNRYYGFQNVLIVDHIVSVSGSRVVYLSMSRSMGTGDIYSRRLIGWDIATGRRLYGDDRWGGPIIKCVAASPDGKLLATGEPLGIVRIRDAATGLPIRNYLQHLVDDVDAIAWSPDGKQIASATRKGWIRVWDAASGKHIRFLSGTNSTRSLTYSPDGTMLACEVRESYWVGEIRVLDTRTGATRYAIQDHAEDQFPAIAFSPDGTKLLYSTNYEVKVCNSRNGSPLPSIERFGNRPRGFTYSPDCSRLLTWGDGKLRVREGKSGEILLTLPMEGMDTFAFDAQGHLYSAGGLSNVPRLEERSGHDAKVLYGPVGVLGASLLTNKDGSLIAGVAGRSEVMAWDARTGKRVFCARPFREAIRGIAFASDGKTLVAQSDEATPRTRAWVVEKGGSLPEISFVWPNRKAPTPPAGYQFGKRDGKTVLVHRDQAAEDRAPMTRWAEPDIAWHLRRLEDAMMDGDDHAADHHLRYLLRDPIQHQDAGLHIHHAHVLARLGKPQESAARLAWALLLDPRVHLRPINYNVSHRSNAAAEAGDWARAIRGYRLAVTLPMYEYSSDLLDQLRGYDSIRLVLAEIASGVPPASRYRLREAECRQFQWVALRLALCVPMPPASTRGMHMAALATHRATRRPYASGRLGAAQYRMGRFEDAARTLAVAAKAPESGEETFVPLFQALTAKRLGHDAEAKAALVRAETARGSHPEKDWRDRIALGALLAETRAALSAPPRMTRVPEGE